MATEHSRLYLAIVTTVKAPDIPTTSYPLLYTQLLYSPLAKGASEYPGCTDPCPGTTKLLRVDYSFRDCLCHANDNDNVDKDSVPMNSKCTIGKQCCDTASNDRRRSSSRESRVTACVFVCVMHNIRYAVCNLTMSMLSHTFYCLMSYHTLVVRYPWGLWQYDYDLYS